MKIIFWMLLLTISIESFAESTRSNNRKMFNQFDMSFVSGSAKELEDMVLLPEDKWTCQKIDFLLTTNKIISPVQIVRSGSSIVFKTGKIEFDYNKLDSNGEWMGKSNSNMGWAVVFMRAHNSSIYLENPVSGNLFGLSWQSLCESSEEKCAKIKFSLEENYYDGQNYKCTKIN